MKKIYIAFAIATSSFYFSQVNVSSTPTAVDGQNTFIDASQNNSNFGPNVGRGLNFPQTDLSTFKLNTSVLDGINYPTAYDGMIVYNTNSGGTTSDTSLTTQTAGLTPGFYYFSNPTGASTQSVSAGKWIRMGADAVAASKAWVQGGNATVANATDAIIGGTNSTGQNVRFFANNVERMTIGSQTGVTVDASTFDFVLDVLGKARFRNGIVTEKSTYPDYVFEKYFTGASKINPNYQFKSLAETEKFVKENNHLPGVTKITEFTKDGQKYLIDAAELSVQNLEKVEELYLHTIEQQKEIDALKAEIAEIKKAISNKQ